MKINIPCKKCGTRIWSEYSLHRYIGGTEHHFYPILCQPCDDKFHEEIREYDRIRTEKEIKAKEEHRERMRRAHQKENLTCEDW